MNDIRAEIKRMLLELLNKEDLDEKQELLSVGLDSLNVIKLIVMLEETFSIRFEDEDGMRRGFDRYWRYWSIVRLS